MRPFTLITVSIIALITLLSACGTKGPLTLPSSSPQQAHTPVADPNTGAGQR
ncbi:LPS translocon maturation chaperone LptM [Georgfuchsia toluolica]|uniref:LPS translocon maturation chaperone LptM n=1 Tax=Georgfuchsia toluolica TaxID=424218 RepID=UPI001C73AA5B